MKKEKGIDLNKGAIEFDRRSIGRRTAEQLKTKRIQAPDHSQAIEIKPGLRIVPPIFKNDIEREKWVLKMEAKYLNR